jgi:hypothetical protein
MSPELKIMLGQVFKDICLIRRRPNDLALVFVLIIWALLNLLLLLILQASRTSGHPWTYHLSAWFSAPASQRMGHICLCQRLLVTDQRVHCLTVLNKIILFYYDASSHYQWLSTVACISKLKMVLNFLLKIDF